MRQGVGNAISIMGSRPTSNNFMIDGTSNVDTSLGTPAAILSIDIIQEFKEQTATYSAEYGFSANQINIVSKSGTNDFHGSAFAFFRNEKPRCAELLRSGRCRRSRSSIRSSPGSTLAGRCGSRSTTVATRRSSCSTTKRRESSVARARSTLCRRRKNCRATSIRPIIDPATGQPFPNNTIPQERWSRLAQAGGAMVPGAEHRRRRRATTR